MHLDMDAFYVNVHLLAHPADAGVPLAVGGSPHKRGVVTSASYEARAFGVRSAMPMKTAVRLCPQMKVVPPDWEQIRACSRRVMAFLREVGATEQVSVDEAYVDLSRHADPAQVAISLREKVKRETGLPASIGLATSKLVAKVASDFDKPEGCTIVAPEQEAAFLAPLPVKVIWGIGRVTNARLGEIGIRTCGQLAESSAEILAPIFGNQTESLIQRAAGIDPRTVESARGVSKSISQEWTFTQDTSDAIRLSEKLYEMCVQVGESLRREELVARTVAVKFRWSDFTTFTRQRSTVPPIDDGDAIFRMAEGIWREWWPEGRQMRLLGVGVSNLEGREEIRQLAFPFH